MLVFPSFLDYSPSTPHYVKRSHKGWSLNARIHPQVSPGQTNTLEFPAPPHWVWRRLNWLLQVWNAHVCMMGCLCLCWDMSTEPRHCWDANPSAKGWGYHSGLFSDRTERQCVLGLLCAGAASSGTGLKPGGVSSSALSRRGSTESIQVLFEVEFIHMLRPGNS